MNRKSIFFVTIMLFILTSCNNVTINNINNPPPQQNVDTIEKIQIEKKESSEKNDSEEKKAPSESTQSEETSNIDNEKFQKASEIADKIYETYQITSTNTVLRENASAESSALEEIPAGTKLFVKGASVDTNTYEIWCQVEYKTMEGYISYKAFNPNHSL